MAEINFLLPDISFSVNKIPFLVAEITTYLITLSVTKMISVVGEITLKVAVMTSLVAKFSLFVANITFVVAEMTLIWL